ncbi:hypothetical protein MES4922_20109 [Mesorhizobium ventifaucium]|uniref:Uncharacterized protein n=1 Tax=Mesorhizobium ventifaucium TaxID=666020 RepID=A0ABN8JJX3_9HYPH|nr:hypothetical protein MES4922_20109 [Mesorhizobium ventifaucium]
MRLINGPTHAVRGSTPHQRLANAEFGGSLYAYWQKSHALDWYRSYIPVKQSPFMPSATFWHRLAPTRKKKSSITI